MVLYNRLHKKNMINDRKMIHFNNKIVGRSYKNYVNNTQMKAPKLFKLKNLTKMANILVYCQRKIYFNPIVHRIKRYAPSVYINNPGLSDFETKVNFEISYMCNYIEDEFKYSILPYNIGILYKKFFKQNCDQNYDDLSLVSDNIYRNYESQKFVKFPKIFDYFDPSFDNYIISNLIYEGRNIKKPKRIFGMEILDVLGQAAPTTPNSMTIKIIDSALYPPNYKSFKNYYLNQNPTNKGLKPFKFHKNKQRLASKGKAHNSSITYLTNITLSATQLRNHLSGKDIDQLNKDINDNILNQRYQYNYNSYDSNDNFDPMRVYKGESKSNSESINQASDNYNVLYVKDNWKILRWLQERMNQSG
ncbi:unnamed protein product [Gordionus sp. m RMFG-2023]